jgi:GTP pyrophosphokinase
VVDLPAGATPVDFAYHVHSELGHRCRGARVDGRIVSLDHALRTGERVEIIRGKNAAPNRDWLRAGNEFVHTARARSKIRHWFRALDRDSLVASGRALLERELRRVAFPAPQLPALARGLGFASADDMLVSLGSGETGVGQVLAHLAPEGQALPEAVPEITRQAPRKAPRGAVGVAGIDNLLTTFAGCCRPLPGDAITGYVTGGRGVSVHRADCAKLRALARSHPARIVDVAWQGAQPRKHPVDLRVVAHDRAGLLRDLVTLLGNERVNVLDLGTTVDRGRHVATVRLTIEIASLEALARMLEKLARVAGVISVRRHSE